MQYEEGRGQSKDRQLAGQDHFRSTACIDLSDKSMREKHRVLTVHIPPPTAESPRQSDSTLLLKSRMLNKA